MSTLNSSNVNTFIKRELHIPVPWGHIAAVEWQGSGQENSAGDQCLKTVLCLHGLGDNAASFEALVPLLPSCYRYICLDLPGHGLSSHFPANLPFEFLTFVIAIRYAASSLRLKRFILLGHSMGGSLGTVLAGVFPDIVEQLLVLDSIGFPSKPEGLVPTLLNRIMKQQLALLEGRLKLISKEYSSYEEALADIIRQHTYTSKSVAGPNRINELNASRLLARDLEISPTGYKRRVDPRVFLSSFALSGFILDVNSLVETISCPIVIIWSLPSIKYYKESFGEDYFEGALEYMRKLGTQMYYVDDLHSMHMENPELVAVHLLKHLDSPAQTHHHDDNALNSRI